MNVQNTIEQKIEAHFSPIHMEVVNESYMHNVPKGSESHFKLVLVSAEFEGKRLIARHRAVNSVLKEQLAEQIHALALHTYTSAEWLTLQGESPASPDCLGGMKSG